MVRGKTDRDDDDCRNDRHQDRPEEIHPGKLDGDLDNVDRLTEAHVDHGPITAKNSDLDELISPLVIRLRALGKPYPKETYPSR